MKQRGNMLYAAVGAVVGVAILFVLAGWYVAGERKAAYAAGETAERGRWQRREIEQQRAHAEAIKALRAEKDQAVATLQQDLAEAAADFETQRRKADAERNKNAAIERGLRDGSIVLRDAGATASAGACGGARPAGPATAGGSDGEAARAGGLSRELAAFLWSEAARADAVIEDLEEQLELAQSAVTAYFELARSRCR